MTLQQRKSRIYGRVNYAVRTGKIPSPKKLNCQDCRKRKAYDYDHPKGYAKRFTFVIDPVCRRCHWRRGFKRGEIVPVPPPPVSGQKNPLWKHGRWSDPEYRRRCYRQAAARKRHKLGIKPRRFHRE